MGGKSPQTRNLLAVKELYIAFCIASPQEQSGVFGCKFYEVNPSLSTTCLKDYCWEAADRFMPNEQGDRGYKLSELFLL
jgi:hypothetical protein